jgi:hypothetical protein
MSMMKHMLAVVMDGIKDAEMIAGYAEEAHAHGADHGVVNWFKTHAQNRYSMAERDWRDVDDELKTTKRDDDLIDALECHVNRALANLRARVDKL